MQNRIYEAGKSALLSGNSLSELFEKDKMIDEEIKRCQEEINHLEALKQQLTNQESSPSDVINRINNFMKIMKINENLMQKKEDLVVWEEMGIRTSFEIKKYRSEYSQQLQSYISLRLRDLDEKFSTVPPSNVSNSSMMSSSNSVNILSPANMASSSHSFSTLNPSTMSSPSSFNISNNPITGKRKRGDDKDKTDNRSHINLTTGPVVSSFISQAPQARRQQRIVPPVPRFNENNSENNSSGNNGGISPYQKR